jgi:predicted signal transduction protein with EAL and GGDEF domain
LTASIGVSVHPEDGRDAATLLKNADMAMYRAKRAGKDKAERFLQRMADEMNDRMEMDSRLRTALVNREFNVVYQPELRPDGSIVAFEALLRWNSMSSNPSDRNLMGMSATWARLDSRRSSGSCSQGTKEELVDDASRRF